MTNGSKQIQTNFPYLKILNVHADLMCYSVFYGFNLNPLA